MASRSPVEQATDSRGVCRAPITTSIFRYWRRSGGRGHVRQGSVVAIVNMYGDNGPNAFLDALLVDILRPVGASLVLVGEVPTLVRVEGLRTANIWPIASPWPIAQRLTDRHHLRRTKPRARACQTARESAAFVARQHRSGSTSTLRSKGTPNTSRTRSPSSNPLSGKPPPVKGSGRTCLHPIPSLGSRPR